MEAKKLKFLGALKDARGIVSTACKAVGISRKTYYNWRGADEEFMGAVNDVEESQIDFVESKLLEKVEAGDTTAIIFYLKTKGRSRGYVEKATEFERPSLEQITGMRIVDEDVLA